MINDFKTAFTTAGKTCVTSYSTSMLDADQNEIETLIEDNTVARVITAGADIPPEFSEFYTEGLVTHSILFMWTMGVEPSVVVAESLDWLKEIWVTPKDVLGYPGEVVDYGNIRIWRYNPVGGVVKNAGKLGSFWTISQPIEYAAKLIT